MADRSLGLMAPVKLKTPQRAGEMAQQVKMVTAKPDDVSLILMKQMVLTLKTVHTVECCLHINQ